MSRGATLRPYHFTSWNSSCHRAQNSGNCTRHALGLLSSRQTACCRSAYAAFADFAYSTGCSGVVSIVAEWGHANPFAALCLIRRIAKLMEVMTSKQRCNPPPAQVGKASIHLHLGFPHPQHQKSLEHETACMTNIETFKGSTKQCVRKPLTQ